ncbi:MAG: KilA-N domain-containing protein [Bacteroidales bacterium]|nr:KilA-N domain-containing protein [Bacteroidales bacterium]
MTKTKKIIINDTEISVVLGKSEDDFICLTDMARYKDNDPFLVIGHWLRNRNTIEYIGTWEVLHNPNFKPTEFGRFMESAGLNRFTLSPKKWIETTNAVGIKVKSGRNGGTYAHKDIAFNFGMWLSPTFQLYIVKEYQQLKERENNPLSLQWDVKRILSKTNYVLHTDAIKDMIIPKLSITETKRGIVYAEEADMLNLALFGCRAKDWEKANPILTLKGLNIRDTASINQLVVLSNMEAMNSEMIKQGIDRIQRFNLLHRMAKEQLSALDKSNAEQRFRKLIDNSSQVSQIE